MVGAGLGAAALGYLLGSIPVAVLVGRAYGVDPRRAGDRNPGYWNAKELLGRWRSLPVFVGDAAKGTAAALAGVGVGRLAGATAHQAMVVAWVAVAAAMVGHAWPVFARFQGGRSILTFAGGMAVLSPRTFVVAIVALVVVALVTRSFAWGARVAVFGAPLAQLVVDGPYRTAATGVLLCLIGARFAQAAAARARP